MLKNLGKIGLPMLECRPPKTDFFSDFLYRITYIFYRKRQWGNRGFREGETCLRGFKGVSLSFQCVVNHFEYKNFLNELQYKNFLNELQYKNFLNEFF